MSRRRLGAAAIAILGFAGIVPLALHPAKAGAGPNGSISGTVTNSANQPVQGVTMLIDVPGCGGGPLSATTAANGTYTIANVPAGSYTVEVLPPSTFPSPQFVSHTLDPAAATSVAVASGQAVTGINDVLIGFGSIAGTVTNATGGAPLSGIQVEALPQSSGARSGFATTTSTGTYTMNVPPGTYQLEFRDPASVFQTQFFQNATTQASAATLTVAEGGTTTGDAAMTTGGAITGTVLSPAGVPEQGVDVFLQATSGEVFAVNNGGGVTDSTGTYKIPGLQSGTYIITFDDFTGSGAVVHQFFKNTTNQSSATSVTVTAPNTNNVGPDTLVAGGTISGTVSVASGTPSNVFVDAFSSAGAGSAAVQSNGTYSITGLPAGTYTVNFTDSTGATLNQTVNNVPVTAGSTSTANATMPAAGHITGTVLTTSGAPASGISVFADNGSGGFGSGFTDSSGNYSVNGLATGSYTVSYTGGGISGQLFFHDTANPASATPVSVTAGQTTSGINEDVPPPSSSGGCVALVSSQNPAAQGQTVTFTATVPAGSVTSSNQVTFLDGGSAIGTSTGTSSSSGLTASFSTSSLAPGTHAITATYAGISSNTVNQVISGTVLTASPNPAGSGQPVTLTATVFGATSAVPTGQVTFNDGTTSLGTATLDSTGVATLTTSALANGTHSLTAVYAGDANNPASTSAPVSEVVGNSSGPPPNGPPKTTSTTSTTSTTAPATTTTVTSATSPPTTAGVSASSSTTSPASTTTQPATTTTPPTVVALPAVNGGAGGGAGQSGAPTTTTTEPETTTTVAPSRGGFTGPGGPPAVGLDSPSGDPGQDLTVHGHGCPPGSPVALSLDGQPVGTATAAADGTYQAHVVVPLVSVGIHDVVAVCRGVTVRTPITIVRFTAAAGSAVTALAATLGFFVVLGLAFVLIRPQSGTTLSAIPEGSQASPS